MSNRWMMVATIGLLLGDVAAAQHGLGGTNQKIAVSEEIAVRNARDGEAFLAANQTRPDVVTLESGLQYKVVKEGSGKKPTLNDSVICHYRGTLVDGTVFASSYERNQPAILPVARLIKGWGDALQLMSVGSTWRLFIPPHLAYGIRDTGKIGPNTTLVFHVELIAIQDTAAEGARALRERDAGRPPVTSRGAAAIKFSFKLDPRLTRGLYLGDRWVSPPTYTQVQEGNRLAVEARAYGIDRGGGITKIVPTWISTDPEMVTVTPRDGDVATITVLRAGESRLEVTSQGLSTRLFVKAEYQNGVLVGSFTSEE